MPFRLKKLLFFWASLGLHHSLEDISMGRMKPAWYYQRQATEAAARATYFQNRVPPVDGTTVNSRGASTKLFYRSLLQRSGTDPLIYGVNVANANLAIITAAEAGLLTVLGGTDIESRLKGSGVKPTKLHWYKGDATPVRRRTAWNTSWSKYYDSTGDRSHYSVPFSRATGDFDAGDLQTAFNGLMGASGTKRVAALGTANGRAYLEFERAPISANT